MIVRQFLCRDPIASSYLLGCVGRGLGAVIDPLFPMEPYLQAAELERTPIRYVIDTHLHADHISAGRTLAKATGAEYVLHESAATGFAFRTVRDGETLDLGNVRLCVLHTPGHTPEHLCLLVTDRTRAVEPWLLLSGHTLMVGDVGRTELASDAAAGARTLFSSLRRLKALPDHVGILPAPSPAPSAGEAYPATQLQPLVSSGNSTRRSPWRTRTPLSLSCSRTFRPLRRTLRSSAPAMPDARLPTPKEMGESRRRRGTPGKPALLLKLSDIITREPAENFDPFVEGQLRRCLSPEFRNMINGRFQNCTIDWRWPPWARS